VNSPDEADAVFRCRSCDSAATVPVIDLGEQPLANGFLAPDAPRAEARFPLRAVRCTGCSLVQLTTTVPPEILFSNYLYASSISRSIVEHAESLVDQMLAAATPKSPRQVIEVASNDGYLLAAYARRGIRVLGIDPARNLAEQAEARGVPTVTELFDPELREGGHRADLLHAHNVLAHVADPRGFLKGIEILLAPGGLATIEVPYLRELLDGVLFDTIYHEHLSYFSMTALQELFTGSGLHIADVERLSIHGGSLRLYVRRDGDTAEDGAGAARVSALLAEEQRWGVSESQPYTRFAAQVGRVKDELSSLLEKLRGEGARLAAYGASAKGTVLLNVFEIGHHLDVVADRSPLKQGRLVPGVRRPIVSPDYLLRERPDYVLLLCWNLRDEVLKQEAAYHALGGRFIVPLPTLQVV
jgi:SAM-dependent methyltransferase